MHYITTSLYTPLHIVHTPNHVSYGHAPIKLTLSIKMLASQLPCLAVFDFRQRHYLLVFLWASLKSSKHFYKSLDFTINNHRPSASEQPAVLKARSQTFKVLFKTEPAFHYRAVCATCKCDENQQLSNLPACEETRGSASINTCLRKNLWITYSKCVLAHFR